MRKISHFFKTNFSFTLLSFFLIFALFNPVFMKFDNSSGWPNVLLFAVLMAMIAGREFFRKREDAPAEKLSLFIFAVAVVISFMLSQAQNFGFSEVMAFLSVGVLYLTFAHRKIEFEHNMVKLLVVLSVLSVLIGLSGYLFLPETRMFGPFFNIKYHAHLWPNAMATFLIMTWPLFLIVGDARTKKGKRSEAWKIAILVGLVLGGLLLTFSRGGLITLLGQLVLLSFYHATKLSLRKILMVVLAGVVTAGIFAGANWVRGMSLPVIDVEEKIKFENQESLTSRDERLEFFIGAWELALDKPIFGWGPFSFREAYSPRQQVLLGSADHPHNVFLKIAAENGFIALGAFVFFLITFVATIGTRFKKLSKSKKQKVYVLGVAISGAFAHSLIDYNFNFLVNLVVLFMLMAMARSLVVGRSMNLKGSLSTLLIAIIIAIFAIFEGTFLWSGQFGNSLYPRHHFLDKDLERHIALNNLDSRAYHLKGLGYCVEGNLYYNLEECKRNIGKALELNPLNDFELYRDYANVLVEMNNNVELENFIDETKPLVDQYFEFVERNVHFTAYSDNVEAAAELVEIIAPYLGDETEIYLARKDAMLRIAERLRDQKQF